MSYIRLKGNLASVSHSGIQSQIKSTLRAIESYTDSNSTEEVAGQLDSQELCLEIIKLEKLLRHTMNLFEHGASVAEPGDMENYQNSEIQLTGKEREVVAFFAKGLSYKETAEVLNCKVSTIQTHAKSIYKKLGVHSRAEAVFELTAAD